jgi:nucleotide-binding universal stress UspA family protein
MTCRRILVGLDDSSGGLAGARFALDLAVPLHARVRFVHVVADGQVLRGLHAVRGAGVRGAAVRGGGAEEHGDDDAITERRLHEAQSLVQHMLGEARDAGVAAEATTVQGAPAPVLLAEARDWGADLVVLGHAGSTGPGGQSVGGLTRSVLEFSDCPVVVVPRAQGPVRRFGDPTPR